MHAIRWHIENKVILVEYSGHVDSEEAIQVFRDLMVYLEQHPKLCVIADFTPMTDFHISIRGHLANEDVRKYFAHPSLGWTISIGGKFYHYIHMMSSFLAKEFSLNRIVVENWEGVGPILEKIMAENSSES